MGFPTVFEVKIQFLLLNKDEVSTLLSQHSNSGKVFQYKPSYKPVVNIVHTSTQLLMM